MRSYLVVCVLQEQQLPLVQVLHALLASHELDLRSEVRRQHDGMQKTPQTILLNGCRVSSLRSRKRPQPSRSMAMFSMFVPEKSSRQTLNMCRITCGGTTLNFVRFDRNAMF